MREPLSLVEAGTEDVNAHREDWHAGLAGEQPDARFEWPHRPDDRELSFGKEEHVPAVVQHLGDILKALADAAALLRKGERVAEEARPESSEPIAIDVAGGGSDGDTLAKAVREAPQEHRLVEMHVVVANDEAGLFHTPHPLAPGDLEAVAKAEHREEPPRLERPSHPADWAPAWPRREAPFALTLWALLPAFNHRGAPRRLAVPAGAGRRDGESAAKRRSAICLHCQPSDGRGHGSTPAFSGDKANAPRFRGAFV